MGIKIIITLEATLDSKKLLLSYSQSLCYWVWVFWSNTRAENAVKTQLCFSLAVDSVLVFRGDSTLALRLSPPKALNSVLQSVIQYVNYITILGKTDNIPTLRWFVVITYHMEEGYGHRERESFFSWDFYLRSKLTTNLFFMFNNHMLSPVLNALKKFKDTKKLFPNIKGLTFSSVSKLKLRIQCLYYCLTTNTIFILCSHIISQEKNFGIIVSFGAMTNTLLLTLFCALYLWVNNSCELKIKYKKLFSYSFIRNFLSIMKSSDYLFLKKTYTKYRNDFRFDFE